VPNLVKHIILYITLGYLLIGGATLSVSAAQPRLETKFGGDSTVFKLSIGEKEKPIAGKTFQVIIHVQSGRHWHVYSSMMSDTGGLIPLSLAVPDEISKFFQIVSLKETGKITRIYDSSFEMWSLAHYTPFDIIATIKVKQNATEKVPFYLYIHYQTCNENMCMPPRTFAVPMTVLGEKPILLAIGNGIADTTSSAALPTPDTTKQTATITQSPATPNIPRTANTADVVVLAETSIWRFILAAAGFGLLALLTPCVFPMVPITVSFFTKRNAGSRKEATKDAVLYALGIIVTFVALGFILSLIAGPAGINQFAANPWANLLIAAIFIAFALNLFGLFEIGVPSSILSKLNSTAQQSKNRMFSVVLMGFVFSLTSFTCTVPFVGTLMVAFSRGSWFVPLIGMVVFAGVFALPFFLLALFPSLMKSLPRSGSWLNNVKVVMGFLEIAAALKFFSNVDLIWSWHFFSRDLVLAAWIAIAIITTLYLLGRFQLSHDTPVEHIGALRVMIAVTFLSVGVYLYTGFHGQPLGQLDAFLPPYDASDVQTAALGPAGSASAMERWIPSYTEALAEAKLTHKNIFIDFTGYTCTNCRAMEKTVFSRQDVQQIFSNFVLARLYTDNGSSLNDSNRTIEEQRFNTIALPYYVIVSPDDKPLATFPGFTRDAEAFKSFLKLEGQPATPSVAMLGQ
jgi:thiol:disulfide interchange protein